MQVRERSCVRSRRLQAALDHLRGHSALIDDLTDWLSDVHAKLLAANDMPAPTDVTALKAVICQQMVRTPVTVEGSHKQLCWCRYLSQHLCA